MDGSRTGRHAIRAGGPLVLVFALGIFVSAALLFSIQPLFAKLALPLLGGAPNVWNTAMVFFQGTLLLGYLYAHLLARHLSLPAQATVHAGVLAFGLVFLPFAIPSGWTPPQGGAQSMWLIGLMAAAIGAPFFALSANAPLLQRWFSRTSHRDAHDPYFLYAASNAGSMAALLAYPLLIEPQIGVREQTGLWSMGYAALIALIAAAGAAAVIWRGGDSWRVAHPLARPTPPPHWRERGVWVALALAPSGLMLAVTTKITTDISPAPLLWVIPLALYLLSFVVVFSRVGPLIHRIMSELAPPAIIVTAIVIALDFRSGGSAGSGVIQHARVVALLLSAYFVVALSCHGELARRRPAADHLTEFYIWMATGGVLGGAFVALIAPVVFNSILELPALLVLAAFLIGHSRKASGDRMKSPTRRTAIAVGALLILLAASQLASPGKTVELLTAAMVSVAITGIAFASRRSPTGFALGVAAILVAFSATRSATFDSGGKLIAQHRSFFSVVKIARADFAGQSAHMLVHGTTIHNVQMLRDDARRLPLTYYSPDGVFGRSLAAYRKTVPRPAIGVVGLGAGAIACLAEGDEFWTFYEIDPMIVRIATNPEYFTLISGCAPAATIKIGDARLVIDAEVAANQAPLDILFIDAFSSDSIPAHLITREALELYRRRIKDDGLIVFHTSNRYMDISSIAIAIAEASGLDWRSFSFQPSPAESMGGAIIGTQGIAIGSPDVMERLFSDDDAWTRPAPRMQVGVWTDDYSNIIGAIIAKRAASQSDQPGND